MALNLSFLKTVLAARLMTTWTGPGLMFLLFLLSLIFVVFGGGLVDA